MQELWLLGDGAAAATDQVLYNLARRAIEWDLLPWCRARRLPIMAYSPIEQGWLLAHPVLQRVAGWHGATAAQVALAWVLRHRDVIAIPRAGNPRHVRENRAALDLRLTAAGSGRARSRIPAADRTAAARNRLAGACRAEREFNQPFGKGRRHEDQIIRTCHHPFTAQSAVVAPAGRGDPGVRYRAAVPGRAVSGDAAVFL
jgi:hypothetical protein